MRTLCPYESSKFTSSFHFAEKCSNKGSLSSELWVGFDCKMSLPVSQDSVALIFCDVEWQFRSAPITVGFVVFTSLIKKGKKIYP